MGDASKNSVVKASIELEQLYLGVPDESVNLTFHDLARLNININESESDPTITAEIGNPHILQPVSSNPPSPLPSTGDFNKDHPDFEHGGTAQHYGHAHHSYSGYSTALDDTGGMSLGSQLPERAPRRRRPGIPHSNICTICSNYIYIFRTRCLVCGRVYCRDCVDTGMGEMTEGRKCVQCLGLRFSQRYIGKAGNVGCCSWRYPSTVKLAELKWAEKGPRRSGRSGYGP
ncbi:hypothetical protein L6164_030719 [Bauhinia variegata]|uniref:Uncharacterized protein n=1 Tax=Bauhinia variegata TaxID=167791 RepID=A0ACB9LEJ9_BAUVA|nr:hypothetical protein L6164_030719 [Bauhinia variegata]